MSALNDNGHGGSSSPWTAADSNKCECVLEVLSNDVLLGRGSGPNDHIGNINFRDLVADRKAEYLSTNHRQTKALIAKDIVDKVYGRGGRFLKKLNPVESAKVLPKLLAKHGLDDTENDRSDGDDSKTCDVYQIQKHSTVMEKAKQALRQNQRNVSPETPENRNLSTNGAEASDRTNNPSADAPRSGILLNTNGGNWNGMAGGMPGGMPNGMQSSMQNGMQSGMQNGMPMGNVPTAFNNNSHGNHSSPRFHGNSNNNISDTFDRQQNSNNYSNSTQGRNTSSYQDQIFQQQQNLLELQQQHELLQMQFQQRQQQHNQQQLEMETHNKLLQEQLELQIRQEQLRMLQQRSVQNISSNAAAYSNRQQEPEHTSSQSTPPAVLNGYATYTTTLDAIEDNRHTSNDGLAHPQANRGEVGSVGNVSDPTKHQDDKSMQMSTMMGSFKDMSVKDGEDQSMSQSIGTIEGVGIPSGLSHVHMSGLSMMSMMNDSTDSLFKNPQKAGDDVGAKNASWGNNSSHAPLADVIESNNPAAVAAAALLGKPVPGFEKAQRRWSGGFIPAEVSQQAPRRMNRRGSLQYMSNSNDSNNHHNPSLNRMQATATAMLAMAHADQERQEQSFNYLNSPNNMSFQNQEMMNQGYQMDGMNAGYRR